MQPINEARQFSIRGLLFTFVVIAFACWLFKIYQWLTPSLRPEFRTLSLYYNAGMATVFGVAVAIVAISGAMTLAGGLQFPSLPGHWLLILCSAAAIINSAMTAMVAMQFPNDAWNLYWGHFTNQFNPNSTVMYHQSLCWGLGAITCCGLGVYLRCRLQWRWLFCFWIGAICATTLFVENAIFFLGVRGSLAPTGWVSASRIFMAFILLGLAALASAVVMDYRDLKPTDWLHRAGVLLAIAFGTTQFAGFLGLN